MPSSACKKKNHTIQQVAYAVLALDCARQLAGSTILDAYNHTLQQVAHAVLRIDCTMQLARTSILFLFINTAPTDIYTLSLHDALPIFRRLVQFSVECGAR